jgi:zinc/manganese transport system substrate-binding protein
MKKPILSTLLVAASIMIGGAAQAQTIKVATSFSILEDLVKNVGGARVSISNFVPRNGDTHAFQPSAKDVKALTDAKLVFVNGLGLEAWFEKLVKNAGSKARVVTLSDGLKPLKLEEEAEHEGEHHEEGEEHGEFDPHMWWNPMNTIAYVNRIRDALTKADPSGKDLYSSNAAAYTRQLANLDAWAKSEVAKIAAPNRKLVTNHDALGYFASRYGFQILGNVIPSIGTEREPSAKESADLIRSIKRNNVKAIFTENTVSAKLAQTIAKDTGAKIAPALYTDALGETGSAGDTYLKAFKHNVNTIVTALR